MIADHWTLGLVALLVVVSILAGAGVLGVVAIRERRS